MLGELLTDAMHARAFLATKVWTRGERSGHRADEHSAQLLKTPRLDLIQVHNLLDLDTQLKTLHAWKEAGRVRYVGVTHYTVSAHADLARVLSSEKLDFVQFNYSPLTRAAEKRLLPLAAERGVAVLVNRPFEDGALFQAVRGKALPAWAAEVDATSFGQLALKFIASHPAVTCIIPATGKLEHLEDNLAAAAAGCPMRASARRSPSCSPEAARAPLRAIARLLRPRGAAAGTARRARHLQAKSRRLVQVLEEQPALLRCQRAPVHLVRVARRAAAVAHLRAGAARAAPVARQPCGAPWRSRSDHRGGDLRVARQLAVRGAGVGARARRAAARSPAARCRRRGA